MATEKAVVVKVGEDSYLTSYCCGETIDGLLGRVHQTLSVSADSSRLYILDRQFEAISPPKEIEVVLNFNEDFNSSITWISSLFLEIDSMILHFRPTIKSLMARKVVLEYIKKNLSKCLGARVFCIGSSMNNIFLPNETIEVTPFLCKGQEDKWFLRVNEGLCSTAMANGGDDENVHVRSITFNCESATILVDINQLNVNWRSPRRSQPQLWQEIYDQEISLVNKIMVLLRLAPVLSRYGSQISHPLVALSLFLYYYSSIDWKSVIISIESASSTTNLKCLKDDEIFRNQPPFGNFDSMIDESNQIKALITNYRLRYQSTIWASTRAKEEDMNETPSEPAPRDSSITERESDDRLFDQGYLNQSLGRGAIAWGITSACPSLTNEFQPPVGLPSADSEWEPENKKKVGPDSFRISHMNISDSIRPGVNIAEGITVQDVTHITSILSCGYKRLATVLNRCKQTSQEGSDAVDLGMDVQMNLVNYFISETMGMSRDIANIQKESSFSSDDAANIDELKSSKYFCESEGPESVMRHAELIMGSKITADAVAHLIAHIVEQAGPHPIGEIGKLLQEATGNPNLSRVLKSQFRGLKKLIEGYPHMLRLGGDHSFNPHVYLADKSSSSSNSESCAETLMEAMTDRESEEVLSPQATHSQSLKKNASPHTSTISPPAARGGSVPDPQYPLYPNSGISGYSQYSYYRPDTISAKQRTNISSLNGWQSQERNQYIPPNQRNFAGTNRPPSEIGDFLVEYGNGSGHKPRTETYRGADPSRTQQLPSYSYRTKQLDQSNMYSTVPRSQNISAYNSGRVPAQSNRPASQPLRYDDTEINRTNYQNRVTYGTLYSSGRDSWDRSLNQLDSDTYDNSYPQIPPSASNVPPPRPTQGNPRLYPSNYEVDYNRSRPNSLGNRQSHGDNLDVGLDFDSERQSFLFPNDYDPGSQSFSLSEYDLLRDAAYANAPQSMSLPTFGHDEGSNGNRYEDIDSSQESYGDSRMLAYFLKDSI